MTFRAAGGALGRGFDAPTRADIDLIMGADLDDCAGLLYDTSADLNSIKSHILLKMVSDLDWGFV